MIKANKKYMEEALAVAKESNCQILQVGAVLGYCDYNQVTPLDHLLLRRSACNGTYPGEPNCNELEFQSREQHHEFADKYEFHAEMNVLMKMLRNISGYQALIEKKKDYNWGLVMYVTHYPCNNCIKLMKRFGVKKIFYLHDYKYADKENQYAKDMEIEQITM